MEIGDLPLYNQDLGDAPPAAWSRFRDRVARAEAVLFVTPEYNRSVPGVLKNAIDVGSRPYGKGALNGKPVAVVSVTPGIEVCRRSSPPDVHSARSATSGSTRVARRAGT